MEQKTRDELWEIARKLGLNVPKNIKTEDLSSKVELAAIEQHERKVEEVRDKLKAEVTIRNRIAEVKVSAKLAKVAIEIPESPTLEDVIRLEKRLKIEVKKPKPSPETLAIEASKKVYALFRNLEQENADVVQNTGGKYRIHLWPDKVHVLPEWLIQHFRSRVNPSGTRPHAEYKEVHGNKDVAARMTRTETRQRFAFEVIGDAPKNAPFGIVTDEAILSKLGQLV